VFENHYVKDVSYKWKQKPKSLARHP